MECPTKAPAFVYPGYKHTNSHSRGCVQSLIVLPLACQGTNVLIKNCEEKFVFAFVITNISPALCVVSKIASGHTLSAICRLAQITRVGGRKE